MAKRIKNSIYLIGYFLVSFILISSCTSDSKEVIIDGGYYTIHANVLRDSVHVNSLDDTLYVLHGRFKYVDDSKEITGRFSNGILNGRLNIETDVFQYTGNFNSDILNENVRNDFISFIRAPYLTISTFSFQNITGDYGYPIGNHVISAKDVKIQGEFYTGNVLEAYFKDGLPTGIWKKWTGLTNELLEDQWSYLEHVDGIRTKAYIMSNDQLWEEANYNKDGKVKQTIRFTYDENSNLVQKDIKVFDHVSETIEDIIEYYENGELSKKIVDGKEYIYEDGVEIGAIVKMRIYSGIYGVDAIDVPNGKVWIPLYYNVVRANRGRYNQPYLYPRLAGGRNYSRQDAFYFPEKSDFVSYRVSKQLYRPVTSNNNFATGTKGHYGAVEIDLYFLEESAY